MMHRFLTVLLGVVLLSGCASHPVSDSDRALLTLPYWQFDQTPAGWRSLADRKQFHEAAKLIEAYLLRHPELNSNEQAMLHFHAAQLFAFGDETSTALRHLGHANVPDGSPGFPSRWNDYVAATQAFLKHDRAGLLGARERLARGALTEQDRIYLGTVDWLIPRFGESYGTAYLSQIKSRK
ncbi:MAG: hypothetical protein IT581_07830 [Verrucomicrobiales bacterium]|nr:hypothetical protein [Verrucomicrobiales bacterium]